MNILGIFVKQPVAGRVKSRLAATIGPDRAAELYAAFVADIADRFRRTANTRVLCYAPNEPEATDFFRDIAGNDFEIWAQPQTELGERMARFFDEWTANDRVVVVGSDSPTLPVDYVDRAFSLLDSHDCIIGPATDGGYYLIGQQTESKSIFQQIDWSTSQVLAQTVRRMADKGLSLALLPPWYDVDTAADLEMLKGHLKAMRYADSTIPLGKTEKLLVVCHG